MDDHRVKRQKFNESSAIDGETPLAVPRHPRSSELEKMDGLAAIWAWVQGSATLQAGFSTTMGDITLMRQVVHIPDDVWNHTIRDVHIATDGNDAARPASPLEIGQMVCLRHICAQLDKSSTNENGAKRKRDETKMGRGETAKRVCS